MNPYLCIPLRGKRGGVALVSERAAALVDGIAWYQTANGYASSPKYGFMHRRLMAADQAEFVDHHNFKTLDNRDENMRCCTPAANQTRRRKWKKSPWPYKGIRFQFGRWYARISGKHLGSFDTAEQAARAYDDAARRLFGINALCNFGG